MSPLVSGGTYNRTYTNTGSGPTAEANPATVSSFRLDKYEVTVGRFRQFVMAWNNGAGYTPPAGSGKHVHLNGGNGLVATLGDGGAGGYESGWSTSNNGYIAPTDINLAGAGDTSATWTPSAGTHEKQPINFVNWYEAAAFCIWDGGFLPTEAEWEYAAAGGNEEREFPWGTTNPGTNSAYAVYGCNWPTPSGTCTSFVNIAPVGTPTSGAGRYGQLDLAGNLFDWMLDDKGAYAACSDCMNVTTGTRASRGGDFFESSFTYQSPSFRGYSPPDGRASYQGFRCARSP